VTGEPDSVQLSRRVPLPVLSGVIVFASSLT